MHTVKFFPASEAPAKGLKLVRLPVSEFEVFEGEDGVRFSFWTDEEGNRLWFKAPLFYDPDDGSIVTQEAPPSEGSFYLLPIIDPKD